MQSNKSNAPSSSATTSASASASSEPKKVGRTPSLKGFLMQTDAEKEELYRQVAEEKKKERLKEMKGDFVKAQQSIYKN